MSRRFLLLAPLTLALAVAGLSSRSAEPALFTKDQTKIAECAPNDIRCFGQAFGNLAWDKGPMPALTTLRAEIGTGSAIEQGCHFISHRIGQAAYERANSGAREAFAAVGADNVCNSGYHHGVAQASFAKVLGEDISAIADLAFDICADPDIEIVPDSNEIAQRCAHGVGHGAMFAASGNIIAVLAVCDALVAFPKRAPEGIAPNDPRWERADFATTCANGAFMEVFSESTDTDYPDLERPGDLAYPCSVVPDRYAKDCYTVISGRIGMIAGTTEQVPPLCLKLPPVGIPRCLAGYGTQLSTELVGSADPGRDLLAGCLPAAPWFSQCVFATIDALGIHYESALAVEPFCAELPDGWLRQLCGRTIGWTVSHQTRDATECSRLSVDLVESCSLGLEDKPIAGGLVSEGSQGDYPQDPAGAPWMRDLGLPGTLN
jgi:hypothetical protein